jgi:conjugative transfer signal peptidase TraF
MRGDVKRRYFTKRRNRFRPLVISLLVLAALIGGLWLLAARVAFQVTGSLPKGLYLISEAAAIEIGDLVVFDFPQEVKRLARRRGWIPQSLNYRLMKPVAAAAGDWVKVCNAGVFINGQYFGPLQQQDTQGLQLPAIKGIFELGEGEFFLAARSPRSFDSRYFGPVQRCQIRAVAAPLAVFGAEK